MKQSAQDFLSSLAEEYTAAYEHSRGNTYQKWAVKTDLLRKSTNEDAMLSEGQQEIIRTSIELEGGDSLPTQDTKPWWFNHFLPLMTYINSCR